MATLKLRTLTCFEQDDEFGTDQPYIKVNGAIVWGPTEIEGAGDTAIDVDFAFDDGATIELWEKDKLSADDLLGRRTVHAGDGAGEMEARFTYENAHYRLRFEVV